MPPIEVQRTFFGHFQNRVTELMIEKINAGQRIGREEAELTIWQQIEADLIEYMYTPKKN